MITIGVDYYPEHWDPALWEEDATRMQSIGIQVVRIAEFAWSRMEPKEGEYHWEWLDEAIAVLANHGMRVILGTPTNCAPVWLYKKYPETLQYSADGQRVSIGIRGHRCMMNPVFREHAADIIGRMAKRYAGRPEIYGWQIDNELESNQYRCPVCTQEFRSFVKERYHTIDAVNRAWGTDVWSGEFSDWDEIPLPILPAGNPYFQEGWYNHAFLFDYEKYAAQCTADYVKFQAGLIREIDPDAQITTNACLPQHLPDFHLEFEALNIAAYDNYPAVRPDQETGRLPSNAWVLDFVRGFKRKNFWVMEQLGGPMGCWAPPSPELAPGMLKGFALQAVAHGADLLSFFRWRTSTTGAEMFCFGLLGHDNRDNRRIEELCSLKATLDQYPGLSESTVKSKVAVLYSSEHEYALKHHLMPDGFYREQGRAFVDACTHLGVDVDVISEKEDFSEYRIVIVPSHFVVNTDAVKRMEEFAESGRTLILTCRSGVKDSHNNCIFGEVLPTVFSKLIGAAVWECDPVSEFAQEVETID